MKNSDWYAFSSGLSCKFIEGANPDSDQCIVTEYKGMWHQGIIDLIETEIFARELILAKLLRELKSKPVPYNKKSPPVFSCMFVMTNWMCFSALLRDN